jgi:hypothetical protein
VIDLVPRQVLEPCPRGIAEVEWQFLDDEEIVCRSPGMTRELVLLETYAGVSVPFVPSHVGWGTKVRRELRIADAPDKGSWTSLVR